MKRISTVAFIILYVGALTYGNICHLVRDGLGTHPMMYFVIWDMFCGWSAFDSRTHIVAEGESGKFYDLTHPPYGEFYPYGYTGRESYDQFQSHTPGIGLNILKHTRHEPITRLFVIEECWAKKYNMVDAVWKARYDDPKDITRYYRRRVTLLPDGTVVQNYSSWLRYQYTLLAMQNPRLVEESRRGNTLLVLENPGNPGQDIMETPGTGNGGAAAPTSQSIAPSGN